LLSGADEVKSHANEAAVICVCARADVRAARHHAHALMSSLRKYSNKPPIYYELCASLLWVYVYQKIGSGGLYALMSLCSLKFTM
jgi:hypothetical protein